MPEYTWPPADQRSLIGKRISRVDGPLKSTGRAKYTFDYNPQGLLYGKVYRSPYAHARVVSVDTSAAESMPGVKAVHVVQGPGSQINWAGDDIAAVAAVDERTAEDAVRAIKVEFEALPHFVLATCLDNLGNAKDAIVQYNKFLELDDRSNDARSFQARQRARTLERRQKR